MAMLFLYTRHKKSIFKFKFNEAMNKRNHILSLSLLQLFNFNQNIPWNHLSSSFLYFDENILSSGEKNPAIYLVHVKITYYPINIINTSSRSKFQT